MKNLLIIVFLIAGTCSLSAQTVNGISLKDIESDYIQIYATAPKMNSNKVYLTIDFGQDVKSMADKDNTLKKDGEPLMFNSVIDGLNYLYLRGYEYLDNYPISGLGGSIYYFILKKRPIPQ